MEMYYTNRSKFYNIEKSFFDDQIPPKLNQSKYVDFSKYKINKPWGHEYLLYGNKYVSIWILCLKKKSQTSMHAHPSKITYLFPLMNLIHLNTLDRKYIGNSQSIFKINKGVFHQSFNKNDSINFMMEFELPNLKNDILRYHDDYGRDKNDFSLENKKNSKILNRKYLKKLDKKIKIGNKLLNFTKLNNKTLISNKYKYFLILKGGITIENKQLKPGCFDLVFKLFNNKFMAAKNTYVVFL
jgi:hypothetical protein